MNCVLCNLEMENRCVLCYDCTEVEGNGPRRATAVKYLCPIPFVEWIGVEHEDEVYWLSCAKFDE